MNGGISVSKALTLLSLIMNLRAWCTPLLTPQGSASQPGLLRRTLGAFKRTTFWGPASATGPRSSESFLGDVNVHVKDCAR